MTNKYNRRGQSKGYIIEVKKCTIVQEELLNIGIKYMSFLQGRPTNAQDCARTLLLETFSFRSLLGFMRMAVPQILLVVKSMPQCSVCKWLSSNLILLFSFNV